MRGKTRFCENTILLRINAKFLGEHNSFVKECKVPFRNFDAPSAKDKMGTPSVTNMPIYWLTTVRDITSGVPASIKVFFCLQELFV